MKIVHIKLDYISNVPTNILYKDTRILVIEILPGGENRLSLLKGLDILTTPQQFDFGFYDLNSILSMSIMETKPHSALFSKIELPFLCFEENTVVDASFQMQTFIEGIESPIIKVKIHMHSNEAKPFKAPPGAFKPINSNDFHFNCIDPENNLYAENTFHLPYIPIKAQPLPLIPNINEITKNNGAESAVTSDSYEYDYEYEYEEESYSEDYLFKKIPEEPTIQTTVFKEKRYAGDDACPLILPANSSLPLYLPKDEPDIKPQKIIPEDKIPCSPPQPQHPDFPLPPNPQEREQLLISPLLKLFEMINLYEP